MERERREGGREKRREKYIKEGPRIENLIWVVN